MKVHLQSGMFDEPTQENLTEIPNSLEKRARLVYCGKFMSMDGEVDVDEEKLAKLVDRHNSMLAKLTRLATGAVPLTGCPPVQLDHSTSAKDTVGRVIGDLELSDYTTADGQAVKAVFSKLRILGKDNVEKVMDGRWQHLSVGADFEEGVLSELSITPFPAAAEASMLSKGNSNLSAVYPDKKNGVTKNKSEAFVFSNEEEAKRMLKTYEAASFKGHVLKVGGGFIIELTEHKDEQLSKLAKYVQKDGSKGDYHGAAVYKTEEEAKKAAQEHGGKVEQDPSGGYLVRLSLLGIGKYEEGEEVKVTDGVLEGKKGVVVEDNGNTVIVKIDGFEKEIRKGELVRLSEGEQMKRLAKWNKDSGEAFSYAEQCEIAENSSDQYMVVGFFEGEGFFWEVVDSGGDKLKGGTASSIGDAKRKAESAANSAGMKFSSSQEWNKLAKKLSEGEGMDKEKLKKHLMEKQNMSAEEADKKLAEMDEESLKKLSSEAEPPSEEAKETDEAKAKLKAADTTRMSAMTAARASLTKLSSDFRATLDGTKLTMRKSQIISRLSGLKAQAKITPAEVKKIDIAKLAASNEATVEAVLKSYEDREPVIQTGALGSIKAQDLAEIGKKSRMSRLEAETKANMSMFKNVKLAEGEESSEKVESKLESSHSNDKEYLSEYDSICKMMDEGKLDDVKSKLKGWMSKRMTGSNTEEQTSVQEQQVHMSELAKSVKTLQNQFEGLEKLTQSLVGDSQ